VSELSRPVDPRGLYFTPLGLGGPMSPKTAQQLFTRECEILALPDVVPATVRSQFAKVLRLYADGVFTYENFTAAPREAHRVLEIALRVRFLEHYAAGVPLVVKGADETVMFHDFEGVGHRLRDRTVRLRGHPHFKGSLASLLRWARAEGYLYGQRNRVREDTTVRIRNHEAHSEFDTVHMPPDAWRALRHVSEMIARLWDAAMPTGSVYPGTIERIPMIVGKGPRELEGTQFTLELLPDVRDEEAPEPVWYVLLGAVDERLILWRPGIEGTSTPVRWLWGPGSWQELKAAAATLGPTWHGDTVPVLDRVFYVRVLEGAVDAARSAAQTIELRELAPSERWFVVLADSPGDARIHVHRVLTGACHDRECGCPATTLLGSCSREAALRFASECAVASEPEGAQA
jgi:hypothetical protein